MAPLTVCHFRRPPTVCTPLRVSRGPPLSGLRSPAASSSHSTTGSGARKTSPRPPSPLGLLTTGILFWLGWLAPETVPAAAFLVPQILGGYFLAQSLQGRRFNAHIVSGGKKASNWIGAGIGLAVFTPLIGAFVVFVLISGVNPSAIVDMQYSVDMGHDQHVY